MSSFSFRSRCLFLAMSDAHPVDLLKVAAALVDDNYADSSGTAMLPAGEHMAKEQKSLASPKSPKQYALQLCERPLFRNGTEK